MSVISGRPPNFTKIVAVFPQALKATTVFAYYPNIYVSGKPTLSDALFAHEKVHLRRQQVYEGGTEAWWDRYLVDRDFRLDEELKAHVVEYQFLSENGSRDQRRMALKQVAERLSSGLYRLGITPKQAASLIKVNAK